MSELTVRKLFDLVIATCFVSLLFLNLPLLVGGHDHHHHHDHVHEHESPPHFKYSREANEGLPQHEHKPKRPFGSADWQTLWIQAIGSTLLVSIAPFILLFFVPLDGTAQRRPLLKVLLSFASGGLLGDAFLHLIPHALAPHDHHHGDDDHDHGVHDHHHHHHGDEGHHGHSHGKEMMVGLWVLAGILIFLFVEKFVRLLSGGGHAHSHSAPVDPAEDKKDDKDKKKKKDAQNDQKLATSEKIQIAGYLNLAADITHNFTDGLAIGASFLAGKSVGFVTTLTILLHEVPHEIGDFAILIQSGCSRKKAIYLQLLTALGALSGTVLSLLADGYDATATSWILPLTAGGFIYIATVSVLPELLADTKLSQSLKEIGALLVGVYMMVLIAQYE